jgi:hypothetical protein
LLLKHDFPYGAALPLAITNRTHSRRTGVTQII